MNRRLAFGLCAFGAILAVGVASDALASVYPIRLSQARWRFGSLGVLAGTLPMLLLADIAIVAAALMLQNGRFRRTLAWAHVSVGTLLAVLIPLFILDALEIRGLLRPEAMPAWVFGVARTLVLCALTAALTLWFGVSELRGSGMKSRAKSTGRTGPLSVGHSRAG